MYELETEAINLKLFMLSDEMYNFDFNKESDIQLQFGYYHDFSEIQVNWECSQIVCIAFVEKVDNDYEMTWITVFFFVVSNLSK